MPACHRDFQTPVKRNAAPVGGFSAVFLWGLLQLLMCQPLLPYFHVGLPHICASVCKHMEVEYYHDYYRGNLSTCSNVIRQCRNFINGIITSALRLKAAQILGGVVYEACFNMKAYNLKSGHCVKLKLKVNYRFNLAWSNSVHFQVLT